VDIAIGEQHMINLLPRVPFFFDTMPCFVYRLSTENQFTNNINDVVEPHHVSFAYFTPGCIIQYILWLMRCVSLPAILKKVLPEYNKTKRK
jgi:hypothetical protein